MFPLSEEYPPPPHPSLCSIHHTYDTGVIGHNLSEVCQPLGHAVGEHLEISLVVMQVGHDPHVILLGMSQAKVQCSEEASSTGDGRSHEAELPQHLVPLFHANASALLIPFMVGKFHGSFVHVKNPS